MDNTKNYIIISIISVVMMIPYYIWDCKILNIFSGIGCSALTASVMALYIEKNNAKKEKIRLNEAKRIYFKRIEGELNIILGKIIWLDDKIDDREFDWSFQVKEYFTFEFMIWVGRYYNNKKISLDEAEKILNIIRDKYNIEKQQKMQEMELLKIKKMFEIISFDGAHLWREANIVKDNKLILGIADYLSIEKIDSLIMSISLGIEMMNEDVMNYSDAIGCFFSAYKIISSEIGYAEDIDVSFRCSVNILEGMGIV